jgi:hypothetical protein
MLIGVKRVVSAKPMNLDGDGSGAPWQILTGSF